MHSTLWAQEVTTTSSTIIWVPHFNRGIRQYSSANYCSQHRPSSCRWVHVHTLNDHSHTLQKDLTTYLHTRVLCKLQSDFQVQSITFIYSHACHMSGRSKDILFMIPTFHACRIFKFYYNLKANNWIVWREILNVLKTVLAYIRARWIVEPIPCSLRPDV